MTDHVLQRAQPIQASLDDLFAFFGDVKNLARLTPPWLGFSILTPDVAMREGALIEYRIHLAGVPMRWRTRVNVWDPPHRFVDEQLQGPYARWVHTHAFEQRGAQVLMSDRVEYTLRFGPLGNLTHRLGVRRSLTAIFDYRARAIEKRFPSTAV